jgi:hypothetical protein
VGFLQKVPGYDDAPGITTVRPEDLTVESFARDFVDRLRPCLVTGAVKHWPAFERWRDLDYLRSKLGHLTVRVATQPLMERAFLYRDSYTDWHYHFTDETLMSQVKGDKEVLLLAPNAASLAVERL